MQRLLSHRSARPTRLFQLQAYRENATGAPQPPKDKPSETTEKADQSQNPFQHQRILQSADVGKDLPLVDFLATTHARDPLSEVFFPDKTTTALQTSPDIPVMLPYRWCIALQRRIRETFDDLEFANKGVLYRAFLHPTFCNLEARFTADGLMPVGRAVLRYSYAVSIAHECPEILAGEPVRLETVVRQLTAPLVVAQTCRDVWKDLGSMVLTDLGIAKLNNVFGSKAWASTRADDARPEKAGLHYLTKASDPARFHPELAGLGVDASGEHFAASTPGRDKYCAISFEEILGYSFIGALYHDKGLPAAMAFARRYMLKYAVSCILDDEEQKV